MKRQATDLGKYWQIAQLTKDLYPEHTKIPQNSKLQTKGKLPNLELDKGHEETLYKKTGGRAWDQAPEGQSRCFSMKCALFLGKKPSLSLLKVVNKDWKVEVNTLTCEDFGVCSIISLKPDLEFAATGSSSGTHGVSLPAR